jgi:predicted permease
MHHEWLSQFRLKLKAFIHRRRLDRDLEAELQFHLVMREQHLQAEGLAPVEARAAAHRQFGNATRIKESSRDLWTFVTFETFCRDLRYGARMLAKNPGFSAVAILTLALGIGANTAIFSFINGTLLRSFPFPDANRLVLLWSANPARGWRQNIVSPGDFGVWRKESHSFEGLAAFDDFGANVSSGGTPVIVPGLRVTANLFAVIGVRPALGRAFLPTDGQPDAPHVVILSHAFWESRYNGDPAIIGKTIRINSASYTVVGIMPGGVEFPPAYGALAENPVGDDSHVALWVALPFSSTEATWEYHQFTVLGRLKPGVNMEQAQSEMSVIAARLAKSHPQADEGWTVEIQTLRDALMGNLRPILLVLMAAVFLVLLIACANVANLQLSRSVSRQKEIAVRSALGASRGRLVRQFLVESGLLSLVGGALGVLLAFGGVRLVRAAYLAKDPTFEGVWMDHRVLLFTLTVSLATALIFGLVPALMASRINLNETLKEAGRGTSEAAGSHRLRGMLVAMEFALALMLLVGAGLLVRTFVALANVNPGFNPKNVLVFNLPFAGPRYEAQSARAAFYDRLLPQIRSLPGVEAAGVVTSVPLVGYNGWGFITDRNPAPPPNQMPDASYQVISPGYFRVMRISVIEGRTFTAADRNGSEPVAIISSALARTYWPSQDALGRHLKMNRASDKGPWRTIVGIVGDVHRVGIARGFLPELYVPYTQYPWENNPRMIVVRSASNPLALTGPIRRAVAGIDPDQAISGVTTMRNTVESSLSGHNFNMILLSTLAVLALALSAVGIYGATAYAVSQRYHEFGIRMALGAGRRDLFKLVLGHGLALSLIGVSVGLAGAIALTRLLSNLLYAVSATDPLTLFAVTLLLILVALAACWIPARRATRVDPNVALRCE